MSETHAEDRLSESESSRVRQTIDEALAEQTWTDEVTIWPDSSRYPIHVRAGRASDESLHVVIGAFGPAQVVVPCWYHGDPETHPLYSSKEIREMKPTYLEEVFSDPDLLQDVYQCIASALGIDVIDLTSHLNGEEIDFTCMWVECKQGAVSPSSSVIGYFCGDIDISGLN